MNEENTKILADFTNESNGLHYVLNESEQFYTVMGLGFVATMDIVIPPTYNSKPVTQIGERAFYEYSRLSSVTIPDSVTSIGGSAFYGCSSLVSITIPNSVTSIGEGAFYGCRSLTSVTIGNNVTSISKFMFENCISLTSITIPKSVTSIGFEAFAFCHGLSSITVAKGNPKYHSADNCLIETASKTLILGCKNSVIPTDGSVTSIDSYAFQGRSLTNIFIPDSVTGIYKSAFAFCGSLTSIVVASGNPKYHSIGNCVIETESKTLTVGCKNSVIPTDGSVTSIRNYAFAFSGLTSINIPDSVTSIGNESFIGCNLTYVTMPTHAIPYVYNMHIASTLQTVVLTSGTDIIDSAFHNCFSLTSISIPKSVTSIGKYAFAYCSSLTSIVVSSDNPKYHSNGNCVIETKSKTLTVGCNNSVIPTDGSVKSIGDRAFFGSGISSVTIPSGVKSIGKSAFYDCSNLTGIIIPNGVKSIGEYAFYDCSSLTSISIPKSVRSVGMYALNGCKKLTTIIFNGTKARWKSIKKDSYCNSDVPAKTVICSDGEVELAV